MAFWNKKSSAPQGGNFGPRTAPPGDPSLPGSAGYQDGERYGHRPSNATQPARMTFVRPDGRPDPKAGRH